MSPARAAAYIGVVSLFAAWLASAAGVIWQPRAPRPTPRSPVGTAGEAVAFDVQAQADRLHRRLSTAPIPRQPARNPFVFKSREPQTRPAPRVAPAPVEAPAPVAYEPELALIGVAEQKGPSGLVRIAMIQGPAQELLMVKVGESVVGRYNVTAVGADAIELTETTTGHVRRLALK